MAFAFSSDAVLKENLVASGADRMIDGINLKDAGSPLRCFMNHTSGSMDRFSVVFERHVAECFVCSCVVVVGSGSCESHDSGIQP